MIYLGTPTWGRIDYRTVLSVSRDWRANYIERWDIVSSPLVGMNRNTILENFRGWLGPGLFMIQVDDDVQWDANVLPIMIDTMRQGNEIVFADMPDRQMKTSAYNWDADDIIPAPYSPKPFHCDAFGAGLFGITRRLSLDLPSMPFDLRVYRGFQRREDLSFSLVLAEMGIKPLCIPNLAIVHHNAATGGLRPRTS